MTLALALGLLAIMLLWLGLKLRRTTGIPWVRIVGSDTGGGQPLHEPLFSKRYGLTGKPDYLLHVGNTYVPVEVKPSRHAAQPFDSDLMQVVAYCVLVEETTGSPPRYGLLRYAHSTYRVAYTPAVRNYLLDTLEAMRLDLACDTCSRSHNNPNRCSGCGFVGICEEALVG